MDLILCKHKNRFLSLNRLLNDLSDFKKPNYKLLFTRLIPSLTITSLTSVEIRTVYHNHALQSGTGTSFTKRNLLGGARCCSKIEPKMLVMFTCCYRRPPMLPVLLHGKENHLSTRLNPRPIVPIKCDSTHGRTIAHWYVWKPWRVNCNCVTKAVIIVKRDRHIATSSTQ